MKRASYRHAIFWIAMNDDADVTPDADEAVGLISVALVADLFEVSPKKVARDVAARYEREFG